MASAYSSSGLDVTTPGKHRPLGELCVLVVKSNLEVAKGSPDKPRRTGTTTAIKFIGVVGTRQVPPNCARVLDLNLDYDPTMAATKMIDLLTKRATDLFLSAVATRYDTTGAILFGSRARGEHRPDSDADIAVLLRGPATPFVAAMRDMDNMAFDVLLETGVRVQPLPVWADEWANPQAYSNPQLLQNIAAEGVPL